MQRKEYDTHQREDLLSFFRTRPDKCFAAVDVVADTGLRQATVYRLLSRFAEEGELVKFVSPDGQGAMYQYKRETCRSHFHLKCTDCGKLIHMDCSFMKEMEKHVMDAHGFAVDNSRTTIYGLCADCQKKDEPR